jgi:hypothetical protein
LTDRDGTAADFFPKPETLAAARPSESLSFTERPLRHG